MEWEQLEVEGGAGGAAGGSGSGNGSGSSRVKKKMAKQLRLLSKLQKTQQLLSAKKTISKKKKGKRNRDTSGKTFNNLSSLAEFLPTFGEDVPVKRAAKVLRSKARRDIVLEETKQLASVLSHPNFKSNPFSAIQQHLTNTLPAAASTVPSEKKSKKDKVGSKKKKNKKSGKKLAEGNLSMDVE